MITDNQRTILRYLIFGLVVLSVVIGLKAVYIDLYDPGSFEARELNTIVNYIFVATIILSIPLLIEKINKFKAWETQLNSMDAMKQGEMIYSTCTPILKKIAWIVIMAFIAAIILQSYWQLSPEVIANYQAYYSPKPVGFP